MTFFFCERCFVVLGRDEVCEQNVKHKPAIEREDLRRLKESDVISLTTPQGLLLISCHPVFLSTWTGRAEKLEEVQFPIPPGRKQKMVRNHGP